MFFRYICRLKPLLVLMFMLLFTSAGYAEDLYKYQNKKYTQQQLPPAMLQRLYEIKLDYYRQVDRFLSETIFDEEIKKDAQKTQKSVDQFREEKFAAGEVSEKEIKEFFAENKHRIPYDYEKAKPQLTKYLQARKVSQNRDDYMASVKERGGYELLIAKPVAPVFNINTAGYPSKGAKDAQVTIVEFSDYQCPHCKEAVPQIAKVLSKFKNKARLVHIDFPLNRSGISKVVAQGAFCAKKQNKYWEYYNLAFDKQKELTTKSPTQLAETLKLDTKKFAVCLATSESDRFVEKGKAEAKRLGLHGTPSIFVNGKRLLFSNLEKDLEDAVNAALL